MADGYVTEMDLAQAKEVGEFHLANNKVVKVIWRRWEEGKYKKERKVNSNTLLESSISDTIQERK